VSQGGVIALTNSKITRQHDIVSFSQATACRQILWSDGPWTGRKIEPEWENYFELKEAEIRQPWVINGHNTRTPDSREACQAIAFYDNFTPEKSRPIKIEPLSVA